MSFILNTTDYSQFKRFERNRPVNSDLIYESIKRNNMLHVNPIIVTKDLYILDGQHRLDAAKRLGVPIYYVIHENGSVEDIAIFQQQRPWSTTDFMQYYKAKNPTYAFFEEMINTFSFKNNIAFIIKQLGHGQLPLKAFKLGNFKFRCNEERCREILTYLSEVMRLILQMGKVHYISVSSLEALYSIVSHKNYNHAIFMQKVDTYRDAVTIALKFKHMSNVRESLIENVYNYKTRDEKKKFTLDD